MDTTTAATNKRLKTDVVLKDYINDDIMQAKDKLREAYKISGPYPHAMLGPNLFQPSKFLEQVREEIKTNSKVNFKESDLFRVYQSIDLANLDDEKDKDTFPTVLELRKVLYSDEWRSLIESIAGLPPGTLNAQVDCACNCHNKGCHLLCHDDVIGTRKISYILYLTDSELWKAEEGGALELYDSDKPTGDPLCVPTSSILPLFNHMAFFEVKPGQSFHAVQEVFGDRPRLSLQGWYHADKPPANAEQATLQRLKDSQERDIIAYDPIVGAQDTPEGAVSLTDFDKAFLKQYLDPVYLTEASMEQMKQQFEDDSSIQLRHFFNDEWSTKIQRAVLEQDKIDRKPVTSDTFYKQGLDSDDWKLCGPSHKQRFLEYTGSPSTGTEPTKQDAGALLQHIRQNVLQSPIFARYLACITSLDVPTGQKGQVRRFRRGLDYTVAHYGLLTEQSVLDATLCFVAGTGQELPMDEQEAETVDEADVYWHSGDYGGFECYIAADDDEAAADEYNQDDDTELLSVSASNNTLSLVYRDPGTMRFVKYVGMNAPSSRWDIAMEYQVPQGDESDVEDDEEHGF